ncbi:chromosome segregation protein Spc25-domain-containing protein [Mycotypha africana]|uniref:chromosome segregation protein Spc25-domain-containing protein n=1 Tax=Mycotypha africana TaxID=64632 RepID=UPI002300AE79|nr:chromosome segregation protein Spc25-domain-containing protein [Mycotypha africana]KAI8992124.1 chromosome segregation protein Spc25-domain-containing protein [Mycotypha africana]
MTEECLYFIVKNFFWLSSFSNMMTLSELTTIGQIKNDEDRLRAYKQTLQAKLNDLKREYQIAKENAARKSKSLDDWRQRERQNTQERKAQLLEEIAKRKANVTIKQKELESSEDSSLIQRKQQLEAKRAQLESEEASANKVCELLVERCSQLRKEQLRRNEDAKIEATVRQLEFEALSKILQLEIIIPSPTSLRFLFKYIDITDPERVYSLQVGIGNTNIYTVSDCEPQIPNLDFLLSQLNEDRDLFKFLKLVRKAFKKV